MMGYQNFEYVPTINIMFMLSGKYLFFLTKFGQEYVLCVNKCFQTKSYLKYQLLFFVSLIAFFF